MYSVINYIKQHSKVQLESEAQLNRSLWVYPESSDWTRSARQGGLKSDKDEGQVQVSAAHFPAHPVLMPFGSSNRSLVYFCHLHFALTNYTWILKKIQIKLGFQLLIKTLVQWLPQTKNTRYPTFTLRATMTKWPKLIKWLVPPLSWSVVTRVHTALKFVCSVVTNG